MKRLTYDDWRLAGYQVRKGEQAAGRDARTGKPTFTRGQVEPFDLDRRPSNPNPKD